MSDDYYAMNDTMYSSTIESASIHITPIDEYREDIASSITEHDVKLNDLITCSSVDSDFSAIRRDIDRIMADIYEIKLSVARIEESSYCVIL